MRVAEMEQKLDSLYSLLASNGKVSVNQTDTLPLPSAQPTNIPLLPFETPISHSSSSSRTDYLDFAHHFPVFSLPLATFDDIQDVISKGLVSFEQAEESIRFFRTKATVFPFVILSAKISLDILRRDRPFLLLTILAFGAQADLKLQHSLEKEIRESLSKRVIVDGEKSMDIVQGLLVYLAW